MGGGGRTDMREEEEGAGEEVGAGADVDGDEAEERMEEREGEGVVLDAMVTRSVTIYVL